MKKLFLLLSLFPFYTLIIGQKLDLIVTSNNDSIVCKIDSISTDKIYFITGKGEGKISTMIPLDRLSSHIFNAEGIKGMKTIR